jgi:hypothetical protein
MEQELATQILGTFSHQTGIKTVWQPAKNRALDRGIDGYVKINLQKEKFLFPAKVKPVSDFIISLNLQSFTGNIKIHWFLPMTFYRKSKAILKIPE